MNESNVVQDTTEFSLVLGGPLLLTIVPLEELLKKLAGILF